MLLLLSPVPAPAAPRPPAAAAAAPAAPRPRPAPAPTCPPNYSNSTSNSAPAPAPAPPAKATPSRDSRAGKKFFLSPSTHLPPPPQPNPPASRISHVSYTQTFAGLLDANAVLLPQWLHDGSIRACLCLIGRHLQLAVHALTSVVGSQPRTTRTAPPPRLRSLAQAHAALHCTARHCAVS